jgi:hypothetical protein
MVQRLLPFMRTDQIFSNTSSSEMDTQVVVCSTLGKALRRLATDVLNLKNPAPFASVVADLGQCLATLTAVCICGPQDKCASDADKGGDHLTHAIVQPLAQISDACAKAVQDAGWKTAKV